LFSNHALAFNAGVLGKIGAAANFTVSPSIFPQQPVVLDGVQSQKFPRARVQFRRCMQQVNRPMSMRASVSGRKPLRNNPEMALTFFILPFALK
jgi:hypothetical protein